MKLGFKWDGKSIRVKIKGRQENNVSLQIGESIASPVSLAVISGFTAAFIAIAICLFNRIEE